MPELLKNDEKKVEYIELIYDLIFVYMIGRNNALIHHVSDGIIDPRLYMTYLVCTLVTIQIWYMTVLFINRYGANDRSMYIGLFVNMFFLYYMADSIELSSSGSFYRFSISWLMILTNIMIQYLLKYRQSREDAPWESANILFFVRMLGIMAAIIVISFPVYLLTGLPLSPAAMIFGIIMSLAGRSQIDLIAVDFPHLSERVMLYVVFTFGEMIIALSAYFGGDFSFSSLYYSVCGFLIVAGLFMSYGFLYDHMLDRDMNISGNRYMLIHIVIIFALSNLTVALEFMREPEVDFVFKNVYITASFVVYYVFLFMLAPYFKGYSGTVACLRWFALSLASFVILMFLFYRNSYISIAAGVALTFVILYLEYRYKREMIDPNTDQCLLRPDLDA